MLSSLESEVFLYRREVIVQTQDRASTQTLLTTSEGRVTRSATDAALGRDRQRRRLNQEKGYQKIFRWRRRLELGRRISRDGRGRAILR